MAPTAFLRYLVLALGPIDPKKLLQPENAVTWVALFAKSGHWIPLRHGDFSAKHNHLPLPFGTRRGLAMAPITKTRCRRCPKGPTDP